jgi:non-homologous end joining protein Ku
LKKDNFKYTDLNSKRDQMGAEQIERMMAKNYELDRQNEELKVEIMTLKRIKNGQGKALQKMTFENNYPQKIKNLVDELKWSKERIKELDEETQR